MGKKSRKNNRRKPARSRKGDSARSSQLALVIPSNEDGLREASSHNEPGGAGARHAAKQKSLVAHPEALERVADSAPDTEPSPTSGAIDPTEPSPAASDDSSAKVSTDTSRKASADSSPAVLPRTIGLTDESRVLRMTHGWWSAIAALFSAAMAAVTILVSSSDGLAIETVPVSTHDDALRADFAIVNGNSDSTPVTTYRRACRTYSLSTRFAKVTSAVFSAELVDVRLDRHVNVDAVRAVNYTRRTIDVDAERWLRGEFDGGVNSVGEPIAAIEPGPPTSLRWQAFVTDVNVQSFRFCVQTWSDSTIHMIQGSVSVVGEARSGFRDWIDRQWR